MTQLDCNSPDGILIAAALADEERAFAHLVARYQPALLRAAISRLGRRELAEEAMQETFLCAHRWLATYDSRFSFRTWLWTILLNQCSRQAKREQKHAVGRAMPAESRQSDLAAEKVPLDAILARESADQLHERLLRLPETQADALRMRFFGGLTFPEIAEAMGCSEAGAKHRVKVGLLKLAQWMTKTGGARSAARTMGDSP